MRERVYLDSCVLSRLTDDQTQERIREESLAIAQVLDAAAAGQIEWIASSVLVLELGRNPNLQRRNDALDLLSLASTHLQPTPQMIARSRHLHDQGYGPFDALHLSIAEHAGASVLLTVDDRFLRRAAQRTDNVSLLVENPVNWLRRRHPWLIKR